MVTVLALISTDQAEFLQSWPICQSIKGLMHAELDSTSQRIPKTKIDSQKTENHKVGLIFLKSKRLILFPIALLFCPERLRPGMAFQPCKLHKVSAR